MENEILEKRGECDGIIDLGLFLVRKGCEVGMGICMVWDDK